MNKYNTYESHTAPSLLSGIDPVYFQEERKVQLRRHKGPNNIVSLLLVEPRIC